MKVHYLLVLLTLSFSSFAFDKIVVVDMTKAKDAYSQTEEAQAEQEKAKAAQREFKRDEKFQLALTSSKYANSR